MCVIFIKIDIQDFLFIDIIKSYYTRTADMQYLSHIPTLYFYYNILKFSIIPVPDAC